MGRRRGWIKRLERRGEGHMIRVAQRDGTTRTFLADAFWMQLFLDEIAAEGGETPDSEVQAAIRGATEASKAEIVALVEKHGRMFLAGRVAHGDFAIVNERPADLSESAEDAV